MRRGWWVQVCAVRAHGRHALPGARRNPAGMSSLVDRYRSTLTQLRESEGPLVSFPGCATAGRNGRVSARPCSAAVCVHQGQILCRDRARGQHSGRRICRGAGRAGARGGVGRMAVRLGRQPGRGRGRAAGAARREARGVAAAGLRALHPAPGQGGPWRRGCALHPRLVRDRGGRRRGGVVEERH